MNKNFLIKYKERRRRKKEIDRKGRAYEKKYGGRPMTTRYGLLGRPFLNYEEMEEGGWLKEFNKKPKNKQTQHALSKQ